MRLKHLFRAAAALCMPAAAPAATLVGYASLPAATFIAGPTSGQFGIAGSGYTGPFVNRQPVQGVQSPDSPLPSGAANLPRSGGFEGMAITPGGTKLYTLLEATVAGDAARTLRINAFDVAAGAFTDERYTYELTGGTNIGEMTALDDRRFLVIERDGGSGAAARFKGVFLVDLDQVDANGRLLKRNVLDLLDIADPNDLNRDGSTGFTFPFVTIESVLAVDAQTLLIVNDNNFPGGGGRGPGVADNNEFILVRLDSVLPGAVPEPATWASMILGLGMAGGTMRRRRAATVPVQAG